jgi:hypothetical protein
MSVQAAVVGEVEQRGMAALPGDLPGMLTVRRDERSQDCLP